MDVYFDKPPTREHVNVGVPEIYQRQTDDGSGHSTAADTDRSPIITPSCIEPLICANPRLRLAYR